MRIPTRHGAHCHGQEYGAGLVAIALISVDTQWLGAIILALIRGNREMLPGHSGPGCVVFSLDKAWDPKPWRKTDSGACRGAEEAAT